MHELVVVGAGLAGCSLLARLHQCGYDANIAVVEAGRGPGGRSATRQRRDDLIWRLDHGCPGLNLTSPQPAGVDSILDPLLRSGDLREEWGLIVGLDVNGKRTTAPDHPCLRGRRLRGHPTMATVCQRLLEQASPTLEKHFGRRVRWLRWDNDHWLMSDETESWTLQARCLVLSGNLLAHPRSLAMLAWPDVPLRSARAIGEDMQLDQVLNKLSETRATVRWNLMLDMPAPEAEIPRQIWLDEAAQQRWQIERLVTHRQADGRLGLVVHGLDDGSAITPDSQPHLIERYGQAMESCLPELLAHDPVLRESIKQARSLGVMRWGAAQPLGNALEEDLQWCPESKIGFCGDWVNDAGFGRAEAALRSGVALAERLHADR